MDAKLNDLMKEAQKMQAKMQAAQKELENMSVTGSAGGGMVKIQMTGRHDVKKVTIDEELMDEEKSMVEDLVAAAVNDAVRKIESETRSKMADITAGMNLPGDLGGGGAASSD